MSEADREVHGFRCKLASCKSQELHAPGILTGRRRLCEIERTERKKDSVGSYRDWKYKINAKKSPSRITRDACERLCVFVGRADFDFFVRFEKTASRKCSMKCLALANSVSLLVLSRSGQHVLDLLLCEGWMCCAVLCCACCRCSTRCSYVLYIFIYKEKVHEKNREKKIGKKRNKISE